MTVRLIRSYAPVIGLVLALLIAVPVMAQDSPPGPTFNPTLWLPNETDAYVQIDMTSLNRANLTLNQGLYTAAVLQPGRSSYEARLSFNAFIPVDLLDLEDSAFQTDILPWLTDSLTIAWLELPSSLAADPETTLLFAPLIDPLHAASVLTRTFDGQDSLTRETIHGQLVYVGDKAAIAITPTVALIGGPDAVRAALAVQAGETPSLAADPAFAALRDQLDTQPGATLTGYLSGASADGALPFLLGADRVGAGILNELGEALQGWRGLTDDDPASGAALLLTGGAERIGIQLFDDPDAVRLRARLVIATARPIVTTEDDSSADLLTYIPRESAFVQRGDDAAEAITGVLLTVPIIDYINVTLTAFPVGVALAEDEPPLVPLTDDDIAGPLQDITTNFAPLFDLNDDILAGLGGYAVAAIPRPNDPLPGFDSDLDVLVIAQADSPATANRIFRNLSLLLEVLADPSAPAQPAMVEGHRFTALPFPATGEPLIQVGAVGNQVIIGTGESVTRALQAADGDNRLIDTDRWQIAADGDRIPTTYFHAAALLRLIFPDAGASDEVPLRTVTLTSGAIDESLYEIVAVVQID